MARGLAGDEDSGGFVAAVGGLMVLAGGDFDTFAGAENKIVMLNLESQLSFEDVEELAGANVGVADFAGAGREELFDDAELGGFDEVPAVAGVSLRASPLVVFGGFCADDLCWH